MSDLKGKQGVSKGFRLKETESRTGVAGGWRKQIIGHFYSMVYGIQSARQTHAREEFSIIPQSYRAEQKQVF